MADSPTRAEVRYITEGDLEHLETLLSQGQSPLGYSEAIDLQKRYHAVDSLVYTVLKDWEESDIGKQRHEEQIIHFLQRLPTQEILLTLEKFLYFEDWGSRVLQLSVKLDNQDLTKQLMKYLADHGTPALSDQYLSSGIPTYVESGREWSHDHCYPKSDPLSKSRQCIWFGARHPRVLVISLDELHSQKVHQADNRDEKSSDDQVLIDSLIYAASTLLDEHANWFDQLQGRKVYNKLQKMDANAVGDGLARHVHFPEYRRQILFLGGKLGISGSETKLNQILLDHGDDTMAEDFLNSGFLEFQEGGQTWARTRGYRISPRYGTRRLKWGGF